MTSAYLDERRPVVTAIPSSPSLLVPLSAGRMRFGGPNAVIVADLHTDDAIQQTILYLVDTVAIPTRYHLHALLPGDGTGTDADADTDSSASRLLDELTGVAQRCIAAGSFLVLGPRLQHAVGASASRQRLLDTGLVRSLVAFDVLKQFDGRVNRAAGADASDAGHPVFDVTDNFDEMSKRPVNICRVACRLIAGLQLATATTAVDQHRWWPLAQPHGLQRLLDVANALSDQRPLDAAVLGSTERVRWLLLSVNSAL